MKEAILVLPELVRVSQALLLLVELGLLLGHDCRHRMMRMRWVMGCRCRCHERVLVMLLLAVDVMLQVGLGHPSSLLHHDIPVASDLLDLSPILLG